MLFYACLAAEAGSNKLMGKVEEPPPDTQFNAGELLGLSPQSLLQKGSMCG